VAKHGNRTLREWLDRLANQVLIYRYSDAVRVPIGSNARRCCRANLTAHDTILAVSATHR
jgi:hypothetical protein